ncbi:MAG TPA: aminotransferase, partial [Spirochaetia bacterium]|nr:aminotransferase [Spirochaetia bacterium]
ILLSDEIHFDLIMPGNRHLPAGGLSPEAEKLSVTLTSATKTFNLSGLSYANAIVPDPALRRDLRHQLAVDALELPNVLALAGAEAGYRHGEPWLDALLAYLAENYRFAANYLAEKAPGLAVFPLEGTYLMWIDFADMGIGDRELRERLLDGGLWLDDGPMFGTGGQGFQRVNIACPRSTLTKALEKIAAVARR